ncbi:MAG: molybdate ABC transporter substrate-binding protein [Candidatus Acididesulfobacter diazotrophicus]|jgi:molybdate transport system substrate-binding protein|uniref:Molybdate ABC transporter substrate-binding protein n=1 Tax=Candidatus Acididesulfobacter diazotrophicus TaxID=2597226 RepID=A0A519BNP2_9DELT|nr:MAG: molybdate ABC transporter substrate-binding protein [Candidatus Acididesulfobacter diazotrophicus]
MTEEKKVNAKIITRLSTFLLLSLLFTFISFNLSNTKAEATTLRILAADALPKPITEIGKIFKEEHPGVIIYYDFLGAGVLKGDIEEGAPADMFLSANGKFQRELEKKGFLNSYKVFAYDYLAAATPFNNPAHVTEHNLIKKLMDKNVSLTTSSPHSDPAGDYTWAMFRKINKKYPGAFKIITGHADHLLDAALVMPILASGNTDLGILYTSQLLELKRKGAKINIIKIASKYNTHAKFTASILNQSKHKKLDKDFEKLLFSAKGKKILKRWGFTPAQ